MHSQQIWLNSINNNLILLLGSEGESVLQFSCLDKTFLKIQRKQEIFPLLEQYISNI